MEDEQNEDLPTIEGRRQTILAFWKENREHGRQHEVQRSVATNLILLLASVDVAAIVKIGIKPSAIPLAIALSILGVLGYLLSTKYYERYQRTVTIAYELEDMLDKLDPDLKYREAKNRALARHHARGGWSSNLRLYKIWAYLHLSIAVAGILTAISCLILK